MQILAPEHFMEKAVSENITAGNARSCRAVYMYGPILPRNERGGANGGLGQSTSSGTSTLIEPTCELKQTGEEVTIAGVRMVLQMTPGTEAPAEMTTYFPQCRAMWMAENTPTRCTTSSRCVACRCAMPLGRGSAPARRLRRS